MTIKIVKAEEKHVTAIGQLWWEFMVFHQNLDPIWTPRENALDGFENVYLQQMIKSDEKLALVALDGVKPVGFALSEIEPPSLGFKREKYGAIEQVAITESYRRKGVGEKLVSEIMKWFKSKNIQRVELETTAQNVLANSFWQKHGFTVYGHKLYKEIK